MEQLLLLSMLDLIIIIRNLPIISFPDIIPFYRFIKQFFGEVVENQVKMFVFEFIKVYKLYVFGAEDFINNLQTESF